MFRKESRLFIVTGETVIRRSKKKRQNLFQGSAFVHSWL